MLRTNQLCKEFNAPGQPSVQFGRVVTTIRAQDFTMQRRVILAVGLLITLSFLTPVPAAAQSTANSGTQGTEMNHAGGHRMLSALPDDAANSRNDGSQTLTPKQRQSIVHANFEKSKTDAAELAALAKGLREELDKPDVNVLSLEVMNRIDKIEKLAKKIREETKGF